MLRRTILSAQPLARAFLKASVKPHQVQQTRKSHAVNYRTGPKHHSKATMVMSELVPGLMWWWILWHLYHEYEHIIGEFDYPDVSSWTNKELGIPSDHE